METMPAADGSRAGPYVLAPGEVRRNPTSVPAIKADSRDSAGSLAVFENTVAPWTAGPPLHLHTAKTRR
jgi:hypothetical protein